MKTNIIAIGTFLALTLSVASQAKTVKASAQPSTSRGTSSEAVTTSGGHSRVGLGFATYGGALTAPGSLSAWIDFNSTNSIQIFTSIGSSSPFTFGIGAAYRYTLLGAQDDGMHIGIGFNLGTAAGAAAAAAAGTTFFMQIVPVAGFHFSLGGHVNNIQLSFDGGPSFMVTPSPFQLTMGALSAHFGAAIHYFF